MALTIGVDATGRMPKPRLVSRAAARAPRPDTLKGRRPVFWVERGALIPTAIHDGEQVAPGQRLSGPALIELPGTTVAIPPGDRAEIDAYRNVVITLGGGDG